MLVWHVVICKTANPGVPFIFLCTDWLNPQLEIRKTVDVSCSCPKTVSTEFINAYKGIFGGTIKIVCYKSFYIESEVFMDLSNS